MSSDDVEAVLRPLRLEVKKQGDIVKSLKEKKETLNNKSLDNEILAAVNELKAKKKILENKETDLIRKNDSFDRNMLDDLLKQRFVYDQSFSIYGGVQGLYDYGPIGCSIKSNILDFWRKYFILEEDMLEVSCSILTPEPVLKSSGHVDRFTDYLIRDESSGDCYRADHVIEAELEKKLNTDKKLSEEDRNKIKLHLSQIDNMKGAELDALIKSYDIRTPVLGNKFTEAIQYNLMFSTTIGPGAGIKGYLRPETAQGIFVNFQRLLHFNQGHLPFASAQIGKSFRNEIAPRSGLIRVREFEMAEIEHFLDPRDKSHEKFSTVENVVMNLLTACSQMEGQPAISMTIGEAVSKKIVANQTLGYFMARIHGFMTNIGVDPHKLRFRQHMNNEMAHYACDCWDAECLTSYGWVECVGCADRSCYDLTQHYEATGSRLVAEIKLKEPRKVNVVQCVANKNVMGKIFKREANPLYQYFDGLNSEEAKQFVESLNSEGTKTLKINNKDFEITPEMVQLHETEQIMHVEEITPNVIEPSFGIGRIMYAVLEHNFKVRPDDVQRTMLALPSLIAPYKCSVLPLSKKSEFNNLVDQISSELKKLKISHRLDESSGSIGRRYARTDQIGIPFGITIDFDSIKLSPSTVTLRERDSMNQIRVPVEELCQLIYKLSEGDMTWDEAYALYPVFEQQESNQ